MPENDRHSQRAIECIVNSRREGKSKGNYWMHIIFVIQFEPQGMPPLRRISWTSGPLSLPHMAWRLVLHLKTDEIQRAICACPFARCMATTEWSSDLEKPVRFISSENDNFHNVEFSGVRMFACIPASEKLIFSTWTTFHLFLILFVCFFMLCPCN